MYKIDVFANCKPRLSECPVHRIADNMLYWRGLDGEVFRKKYNNQIDDFEVFNLGIGNIGSIIQQDDFLLLLGDNGSVWKWDVINQPILLRKYNTSIFNDCVADVRGRIYCGILAENFFDDKLRGKKSYLAVIDLSGNLNIIEELAACTPNGIRFSPENDKLYFGVTDLGTVFVYDYDPDTGKLSNRRVFAENCNPDGIVTDSDGNLWVTNCWPGCPLICYNQNGKIIDQINFPVNRITSVNFGSAKRDTLYITTAHEGTPVGKYDGGIFSFKAGNMGIDEYFGQVEWLVQ